MSVKTIPSREFTRDVAAAKRATATGPVFITDRGKPAYALLKIADYYELASEAPCSLLEAMDAIEGGDFEFEAPKISGPMQPATFE